MFPRSQAETGRRSYGSIRSAGNRVRHLDVVDGCVMIAKYSPGSRDLKAGKKVGHQSQRLHSLGLSKDEKLQHRFLILSFFLEVLSQYHLAAKTGGLFTAQTNQAAMLDFLT